MFSTRVFLVCLLIGVSLAEEESGAVNVLTEENFEEFIKKYDFVLVKFYAPWCGHCKAMAPAFEGAANSFKDSEDTRLAKVDATVQQSLAAKYEVRGYPTILFFKNGVPLQYTGPRDEQGIVSWVNTKKGPAVIDIDSEEALNDNRNQFVIVVGLFENKNEIFEKLAEENDNKIFATISNKDLLEKLDLVSKSGIAVITKTEVNVLPESEITSENIAARFIHGHSLSLINEFSETSAQQIFGGVIHEFLFVLGSKSNDNFEGIFEQCESVARENRGKLVLVYVSPESPGTERIYDFIGVPRDTQPTFRILNLSETPKKYKPAENQSVADFVLAYFENRAIRDLKTETLPADWKDGNIKYLVGSNFVSFISSNSGYVFVKFYAPWCGHCKQFAPVWEELASKFASNENIVFAKLDSTSNDLENVTVDSFPTLKLFKNGQEIETYSGDRSAADVEKFINKYINAANEEDQSIENEDDEKVHEEL